MPKYKIHFTFSFSVSATSQHVPEALQKWHETSKALEQNQTTLSEHILEIQKALKAVNLQVSLSFKNSFDFI